MPMASEKEEAETSTVEVGVDRGNAAVDTGRFRKGIEEWGRVRFWPAWPGTTAGSGSEKLWARALKRAFDMVRCCVDTGNSCIRMALAFMYLKGRRIDLNKLSASNDF